jgi:hypothetical protein
MPAASGDVRLSGEKPGTYAAKATARRPELPLFHTGLAAANRRSLEKVLGSLANAFPNTLSNLAGPFRGPNVE